jgi:sodium transport system permease protein
MRSTIVTSLQKELLDASRDRRTLLTIFITAIVMGPVFLVLMANYVSSLEQKNSVRQLMVDGIEHSPELANFLARNDYRVIAPPADYDRRIRNGDLQDAVVVVPGDFRDRFAHGETIDIVLEFDESRNAAQASIRRAENLLQAFSREVAATRLVARGISPDVLRVVNVDRLNTATPKQQGAFLLFLIPMFGLIGAMVGSMSAAIDSTAGERERGSLEPLLMNPVELGALVVGKWITVAMHSCGVVILTMLSFAIAASLTPSDRLGALFQFGAPEFLRFCALMLPFAAMIAAFQMLVATYGRTYKEAQTYASYIALVVNFVPLITVFSAMRDAWWQLLVPALAQQMVLSRVLRGDVVGPIDYLVPLLVAALLAVACLFGLTRLLRRERIIFGR